MRRESNKPRTPTVGHRSLATGDDALLNESLNQQHDDARCMNLGSWSLREGTQ